MLNNCAAYSFCFYKLGASTNNGNNFTDFHKAPVTTTIEQTLIGRLPAANFIICYDITFCIYFSCKSKATRGFSQVISFKTKKDKNELTTPKVRKEVNKPILDNFDAAIIKAT